MVSPKYLSNVYANTKNELIFGIYVKNATIWIIHIWALGLYV